ncbi:protein of unknown function [Pseudomonas mediterranea]
MLEKPCLATGLFRLWGESLAKLFVWAAGAAIGRLIWSLRSFLQESYVLFFSTRPYGERRVS